MLEANPDFRELKFPAEGDPADAAVIKAYAGRKLPLVGRVEAALIEEAQPRLLAFNSKEIDYLFIPNDLVNQVLDKGKLGAVYVKAGVTWSRVLEPSLQYTYFNMEDPLVGGYTPERMALRRAIVMGYD
ncbi:MAG: heme-binding protein, partial [Betaproteobacteria bacterium]